MCNDAREDQVMFLSPEEFIGGMPEQYEETLRLLRLGLRRCDNELDASKIRSMLADCGRSVVISRRYHHRSYNNPRCLSMVQVRPSKEYSHKENEFERKMADAVDDGLDVMEVFNL